MTLTKPQPLFFVHIPKTGGTSFRKAAESVFSKDEILYDYNPKAKETSDLIKRFFYDEGDMFALSQALAETNVRLMSGHINAARYLPIFGVQNTVSIVRDPVDQLISHFRHFKRDNGFSGTFEEFADMEKHNAVQSRLLQGVPIEAYRYIGLTEDYDVSLREIGEICSAAIPSRRDNVTGRKQNENTVVTYEMREIAFEKTVVDRALYEKVKQLNETRKECHAKSAAFVHGTVTNDNKDVLSGFAFVPGDDQAVTVHLEVNGKPVLEPKLSKAFRPIMAAYKAPRGGYVGFDLKKPPLRKGDTIKCVATASGQVLWESQ